MKNFLVTVFLLLTPILLVGQNTIKYSYDAAGNRTERTIILATKSAIVQSDTIFTDQLAERDIKIYPNPTDGFLKVEIGNTEGIKNCTITISAMNTGKQVKKIKATLPLTDIDVSNQPFGVYIMLIDIDGKYTSWKIIKR